MLGGGGRCPGRSCTGGGGRWRRISGGGSGSRRAVNKVPGAVNHTGTFIGKEVEETTGKVEAIFGTPGTFVHDGSSGGLSVVRHANLLEAMGARVSATELLNGQGQVMEFSSEGVGIQTGVFRATIKSLATLN